MSVEENAGLYKSWLDFKTQKKTQNHEIEKKPFWTGKKNKDVSIVKKISLAIFEQFVNADFSSAFTNLKAK